MARHFLATQFALDQVRQPTMVLALVILDLSEHQYGPLAPHGILRVTTMLAKQLALDQVRQPIRALALVILVLSGHQCGLAPRGILHVMMTLAKQLALLKVLPLALARVFATRGSQAYQRGQVLAGVIIVMTVLARILAWAKGSLQTQALAIATRGTLVYQPGPLEFRGMYLVTMAVGKQPALVQVRHLTLAHVCAMATTKERLCGHSVKHGTTLALRCFAVMLAVDEWASSLL
jgi:hypothetical protein